MYERVDVYHMTSKLYFKTVEAEPLFNRKRNVVTVGVITLRTSNQVF